MNKTTTYLTITTGEACGCRAHIAESWDEHETWDGNNHISDATGSQWDHERLHRTKKGTCVLETWSQRQDVMPCVSVVSEDKAHRWLILQGHAHDLPASVLAALEV